MKLPALWLSPALLLACSLAHAQDPATQNPASWTVKPDWVRAHEEFLASDLLQGRGSATRDEGIAATYVASEFRGYGLQTAPGLTTYIQAAELLSPVLDGHATLTAGDLHLTEGDGVTLLESPGTGVSGPLAIISSSDIASAHIAKGSIVAVSGPPPSSNAGLTTLLRAGAAAVVVPDMPGTSRMFEAGGGKTRTPVRLAGMPERRPLPTLIALSPANLARFTRAKPGTPVTIDVHTVPQTTPRQTYNAIGYLPGTDPSAGTLLLTAHLDHLGVGRPENGDGVWNGANDDAAGTTAVLELAHALASGPKPRRSILFVCYGSEELGEYGSTYFGEHPPVPLKDLVANLEFEMIGNQDPKMPKGVLLLTGWDRSNLGPALREHGALLGPDPYPEEHFFERSDNYSLALKGVVAHTAAGWGDPPTYHRPDDDLAHLDLQFMTAAIQSLVEPVRWLATGDFVPKWNPNGQPKGRD